MNKENKYKDIINETVDHFSDLVLDWSESEFGNFNSWLSLLKNIVIFLTQHYNKLTEIQKTNISVKVVVELAIIIYEKYTKDLESDKIEELKKGKLKMVVLVIDNPDILRGSVSMLNDVMNKMDADNDGKISKAEFCKFICPCFK